MPGRRKTNVCEGAKYTNVLTSTSSDRYPTRRPPTTYLPSPVSRDAKGPCTTEESATGGPSNLSSSPIHLVSYLSNFSSSHLYPSIDHSPLSDLYIPSQKDSYRAIEGSRCSAIPGVYLAISPNRGRILAPRHPLIHPRAIRCSTVNIVALL